MKVENGSIIFDDEIVILDNVAMINVTQVGSHFDKPKFSLSIVYDDCTSRTIGVTVDNSKSKLFRQLNKLGKEIIDNGNENYANLGFALINMDKVNRIEYDVEDKKIIVLSSDRCINTFKTTTSQAKRVLAKMEDAYNRYNQSRVKQL